MAGQEDPGKENQEFVSKLLAAFSQQLEDGAPPTEGERAQLRAYMKRELTDPHGKRIILGNVARFQKWKEAYIEIMLENAPGKLPSNT
jgi:hypothetical protein